MILNALVHLRRATVMVPTSVLRSRWLSASAIMLADEITVNMPSVAESISEGVVSSFEKKIGEAVGADEAVIMVETDKTTIPVQAPKAGVVTKFFVKVDETVTIGAPMFTMKVGEVPATAGAAVSSQKAAEAPKATTAPQTGKPSGVPPKAVKPPATAPPSTPSAPTKTEKPATPSPSSSASPITPGGVTRVKMRPIRKRTAQRLKEAQNTAAMLTTFNEVDMSNIMEFRNKYKDAVLKKHNVKLGFMSAFMKAASVALMQEPSVNGYIDTDGETIVYHDYVNISVAVATPKGLVVPVIRNAHQMNYIQIEKAISEMGEKARTGELAIEDMDGGTFTISNGGVFGSLMGTPIINPPQSAILGMHGIFDRPVAINGKVEIRPMMYVALTYDHRLIDGREAVTFLRKVKEGVEDPRTLLLD